MNCGKKKKYEAEKLKVVCIRPLSLLSQVTIKINGSPSAGGAWWNQIVEGTDVRISCSADANPPVFKYSWYLNDSLIQPDTPIEWVLKNVSRFQNEAIVKCEAENGVGKSEDSETLHIFCECQYFHKIPYSSRYLT